MTGVPSGWVSFTPSPTEPNPARPDVQRSRRASQPVVFASEQSLTGTEYDLQIEATLFADAHGFEAVWSPSDTSRRCGDPPQPDAPLRGTATRTSRVHLRAGGIVAPLHDPVRLVEDWSMLSGLSRGRVGIAFASGWSSVDSTVARTRTTGAGNSRWSGFAEFRELWHTRTAVRPSGTGKEPP